MKRSKQNTEFWTVLTLVNLLGLIYPILDVGRAAKRIERTECCIACAWQAICSFMDGTRWQH
jgi:hypothetical protein